MDYYTPQFERCFVLNEQNLEFDWPCDAEPTIAATNAQGTEFKSVEVFAWCKIFTSLLK